MTVDRYRYKLILLEVAKMKDIMIDEKRDFKGVWIPKEIYLNPELSCTEKFLLVEIQSLSENGECFASNDHFAKFLGIAKNTVAKMLTRLRKLGYLETHITYKAGTCQVEKRVLTVTLLEKNPIGIGEKSNAPIGKKSNYKNTYIKNTKEEYINKNNKESSLTELGAEGENLVGYKEDETLTDDFELEVDKWHWKSDKAYRDYIEKVLPKYIQEIATEHRYNDKSFVSVATKVFTRYFYYFRVNRGEYHPWYTKERLENILNFFFKRGMSERGQGNIDLGYLDSFYRKFFSHKNMPHDYHMEVFATDKMIDVLEAEIDCGGYGDWQEVL